MIDLKKNFLIQFHALERTKNKFVTKNQKDYSTIAFLIFIS